MNTDKMVMLEVTFHIDPEGPAKVQHKWLCKDDTLVLMENGRKFATVKVADFHVSK